MLPQVLFPSGTSKTAIAALAAQAVSEAIETGNPIAAAEIIAALETFVKSVKDAPGFKEAVREELEKNGGKITTPSGAKLELAETGVSYDYSHDPEWVTLNNEIADLTEQRKALEERMRSIAPGKMSVDKETGEVLLGAAKASKSTYRLTLAK